MIKKDKIFELKIEEDDEVSGIDSISLVDEPAIEVNWIAFKKEAEHEFHIPDNEDQKYLDMLITKGENEQEMFNQGWIIDRIEEVGKEDFATTPNKESIEDTEFYRVRYKYGLNPNISQRPIIATTRDFCKELINKNYVWRVEDIEGTRNDFGQSAQFWRGGYNCRHQWYRIFYKLSGDIINKSSVNKNKVAPDGFPVELDTEWIQPNTITSKTANNPKPSTIRNLGLSKEQDLDIEPNPCWEGYEPIGLKPDGSPNCVPMRKIEMESVSDYPDAVKNNAKAVLKWVEENGWGSCGTEVGKQRANQLAKGEPISLDTVKRMYNYLSRHEGDLDSSKGYGDGCGKLMYDAWGGKTALNWAKSKLNDFGYDVGTIGGYVDPGIDKKKKKKDDQGIISKSLVEPTTFETEFPYLFKKTQQRFQIDSEEKRIVLGPAMIPDMKIFRKDAMGNPYYVFFSAETIKMIAEKYMRNKYLDNNDQMHDGKAVSDVYVIESWIKEDENDKSSKYGFSELPVGTWFVSMKVKNNEIWNKVKEGVLNGFSVSGFFEEVAAFSKEEMFLYKVSEVLKNIKE